MCSQSSSDDGPFFLASAVMSWGVFPAGSATGIISCVIGNDSWFWNRNSLTPADRWVGMPWNRNFWTKIFVSGGPPLPLERFLAHPVPTRATTDVRPTSVFHVEGLPERITFTARPPFGRRASTVGGATLGGHGG